MVAADAVTTSQDRPSPSFDLAVHYLGAATRPAGILVPAGRRIERHCVVSELSA